MDITLEIEAMTNENKQSLMYSSKLVLVYYDTPSTLHCVFMKALKRDEYGKLVYACINSHGDYDPTPEVPIRQDGSRLYAVRPNWQWLQEPGVGSRSHCTIASRTRPSSSPRTEGALRAAQTDQLESNPRETGMGGLQVSGTGCTVTVNNYYYR
jgi:hypothetical protein